MLGMGLLLGEGQSLHIGKQATYFAPACAKIWASLDPHLPEHQDYVRPLQPFTRGLPRPGCPCTTWDDDRHTFTEARPGWVRYTNARFGFSVEVPADWFRACPLLNGDGQRFVSPDGMVQLRFYGFMNIEGETLDAYVRKWVETQGTLWSGYREVDGERAFMAIRRYVAEPGCPRCTNSEGCFLEAQLLLVGLDEGRGISLLAANPRFPEALALLEEILTTYRAGEMGRRPSP